MQNLLKETLQCLENNGKNPLDVLWIATNRRITNESGHFLEFESAHFEWKEFESLAALCNYEVENCDDGLIPLKIVGNNWWIERDGTDWYFKKCPRKPTKKIRPTSLVRKWGE